VASVFHNFTNWAVLEQIPVPKAKPGTAGEEIVWGLPSSGRIRQDVEQPVLCGGVRVRQDWGAPSDRAGASAATLALPETT